jgi:hypothetical protein
MTSEIEVKFKHVKIVRQEGAYIFYLPRMGVCEIRCILPDGKDVLLCVHGVTHGKVIHGVEENLEAQAKIWLKARDRAEANYKKALKRLGW